MPPIRLPNIEVWVYGSVRYGRWGQMLRVNGDAITVNRNKFHDSLKAEFQTYLAELRDPKHSPLRSNFRKKMNRGDSRLFVGVG